MERQGSYYKDAAKSVEGCTQFSWTDFISHALHRTQCKHDMFQCLCVIDAMTRLLHSFSAGDAEWWIQTGETTAANFG